MLRFLGWVFLLLIIVVGVWGYFFMQAAGAFLTIAPKPIAGCKQISSGGIAGVEDLTIDAEAKLALLSGYDRRERIAGKTVRGAIWTYAIDGVGGDPVDATAGSLPQGFHPHGISLYRSNDGRKTLFVINHAGGKHSIEIFDVAGGSLVHRRTVTGSELISPNDIVGVGHDQFYVTNDHAYTSGWRRTLEDFGRLRLTTVFHFNGSAFTPVIEGLGGSNGINVSADGREVYVSAGSELTIYVYDRDLSSNKLVQRSAVGIPGFPDNIEVMANGDLLVGVHSKIFDLLSHVQDATKLSPSHVVLLSSDKKGGFVPSTIYYNNGEEISGASVGGAAHGRLLIGPIFEHKILDCPWVTAP